MADEKTIIADGAAISLFKGNKRLTACLVQYNGHQIGKRYLINKPQVVIGRAAEVDIVLNEQSVSRQHAALHTDGEAIEIEDRNSSNGTFINDERIQGRRPLKDGDIVRLGTVLLKYFSKDNIENLVQDKIYRLATIDGTTETFNKDYLLETIETEFANAKATAREFSIIYFDLDFFKKVNDTYGHSCGDYILKQVSTLVKSVIRKEDALCRFGGEEFVILMPGTPAKTAYEMAERIRTTIAHFSFEFGGQSIKQTVSLGVSQLNPTMNQPADLLEDADKKLYKSKQNGRNQVTI